MEAKEVLKTIANNKHNYSTIHYSCQSICGTGLIPKITSIAISNIHTWQAESFSIHISAHSLKISPEDIPENYDKVEADMLRRYFEYLKTSEETQFVHWNMRDCDYGFHAIELRGRLLCPDAVFKLPNERKVDLSRLITKLYGQELEFKSLIEYNYPLPRYFMEGKEEAIAFDKGEYVRLYQSTSIKAVNISKLLDLAINRELKTNATISRTSEYVRLILWILSILVGGFLVSLPFIN